MLTVSALGTSTLASSAAGATTCDAYAGGTTAAASLVTVSRVPIAADGTLGAGASVGVAFTAIDAAGNCVSGAPIFVRFTGPGSAYPGTVARCPVGGTGSLTSNWAACTTDASGVVPVLYVTPTPLPNGGTSQLEGAPSSSPLIKPTATTTYTFGSLAVSAGRITATEGQLFSGTVATFTAQYLPNAYSFLATIQWGDGTSTAGTIVAHPSAVFEVTGVHTYLEENSAGFPMSVTISGPSGPSATGTGGATVRDAPLTSSGTALTGKARRTMSGVVATFKDADAGGTASDYTATVNWGDGSSSTGTISPSGAGFAVTAAHAYKGRGTYTISVAIADIGGATTTVPSTATIHA